jgi:hypothetical protein
MSPQLENEKRPSLTLGDIFRDICTRAGVTPDEEAIAKLGGHIETTGYLIRSNPPTVETMTVEEARKQIDNLGDFWRSNFVTCEGYPFLRMDGQWTPAELRRIADLWDACHDEEGNER